MKTKLLIIIFALFIFSLKIVSLANAQYWCKTDCTCGGTKVGDIVEGCNQYSYNYNCDDYGNDCAVSCALDASCGPAPTSAPAPVCSFSGGTATCIGLNGPISDRCNGNGTQFSACDTTSDTTPGCYYLPAIDCSPGTCSMIDGEPRCTTTPPVCNTDGHCTACTAPANTCSSNNGTCTYIYDRLYGGGSCTTQSVPGTACTLPNCSSGYSCSPSGSCVSSTKTYTCGQTTGESCYASCPSGYITSSHTCSGNQACCTPPSDSAACHAWSTDPQAPILCNADTSHKCTWDSSNNQCCYKSQLSPCPESLPWNCLTNACGGSTPTPTPTPTSTPTPTPPTSDTGGGTGPTDTPPPSEGTGPGVTPTLGTGLPSGILTEGLFTSGIRIIWALVTLFVIICVLAAIYYIFIGGLNLITSRGHKENIANNRDAIYYAVLGLFFVFLCFIIIEIFGSILGINLLSFITGSGSSTTPGGTSGGSSSSSSTVCKGSCRHDCDDSADQTNTSDCRPPNRYCCVGE